MSRKSESGEWEDSEGEEENRGRSGPSPPAKIGSRPSWISIWILWNQEWARFAAPCTILKLKELLHNDAAAIDIYQYSEASLPPPRLAPITENPLPGYILIPSGAYLIADLTRRAPARLAEDDDHRRVWRMFEGDQLR